MKKYSLWKLAGLFLAVALTFGGCADANLPVYDDTTGGGGGTGDNTTADSGYLADVTALDAVLSLNNPTAFAFVTINGQRELAFIDGFNLGSNEGRLMLVNPFDQNAGANGLPVVQIMATTGIDPDLGPALDRPFDLISDGTNLYVSVGFGLANEGKILKVSNITLQNGTATADFEDLTDDFQLPLNPLFMTLVTGPG